MADAGDRDEVLNRLRQELLEFVLDQTARRVVEDAHPRLSPVFLNAIGQEVEAAVVRAAAKIRAEEDEDSDERPVAPAPPSPPRPVDAAIPDRPNDAAMPAPGRAPPVWALPAAGGLVALLILVGLGGGYYARSQQQADRAALAARAATLKQVCETYKAPVDQAVLFKDTKDYKDACSGQPPEQAQGSCALVARLEQARAETAGACS